MKSDHLIPWYFVSFFIGLTIIFVGMGIIAFRVQSGTVVKHPYEQGLAYNNVIAAHEKQDKLGWSSAITFDQKDNNSGRIIFSLRDKSGRILIPDWVSANITRPSKEGMDFQISLKKDDKGIFAEEVRFPIKGLWELRIFAKNGDDNYQIAKRVVLE